MVIAAAEYPFLNIFWTMLIFFSWVIWIWMVIGVLADVFSRHDVSGWGKAAWAVFIIVLPFLGVLIYLITHGSDMAERKAETLAGMAQPAGARGPAGEIERAKALLDRETITRAEFDTLKAKALAA
jgi:hypothetical protein